MRHGLARGLVAGTVIATLLLATVPRARAAGDDDWYGWQIMSVDAVAVAALVTGGNTSGRVQDVAVTTGWVLLLFGGAGVHIAHDRPATAATSFSVRIASALFAGITLLGGGGLGSDAAPSRGRKLLAGAIAAAALVLDWWLLAASDSSIDASSAPAIRYGWTF